MAIIDRSALTRTLYATTLSVTLPQPTLKLEPDQLFDATFLETLSSSGGRVNTVMEISPELTDTIKMIVAARKALIRQDKLTHDDKRYLLSEDDIEWWIEQVESFKNNAQGHLDVFTPTKMAEIQEDFRTRLYDTIYDGLKARSSNLTEQELADAATASTEKFLAQKFPDASSINCGMTCDFGYPVAAIAPVPAGLSPAAADKLKAKQLVQITALWNLIVANYEDLEVRAIVGELHTLNPGINYRQQHLTTEIEAERERVAEKKRLKALNAVTADGTIEEEETSTLPTQFSARVARVVIKDSAKIKKILTESAEIQELAATDPAIQAEYDRIVGNCDMFIIAAQDWVRTSKIKKGKNNGVEVVAANADLVVSDDDEEIIAPVTTATVVTIAPSAEVEVAIDDDDDAPIEFTVNQTEWVKPGLTAPKPKTRAVFVADDDDEPIVLDGAAPVVTVTSTKTKATKKKKPIAKAKAPKA